MRAKNTLLVCLIAILLAVPLITNVGTGSTTTRLYVDPPEIIDSGIAIDTSISIEVKVENVIDLYGWGFNLTFRPDMLQVLTVTHSSWMGDNSDGWAFATPTTIDNTAGYVFTGQIIHPGAPPMIPIPTYGATGNGTLITVTFNVTGVGASYIDLASTKLNTKISGNNVPIPHTAEDGLFDNRLEVLPPVAIFTGPSSGVVGETLVFNASDSNDDADNGWLVSYEWDFSLGNTFNVEATGEIVTHSFESKGSYTVALRVTDNDGYTDVATVNIPIATETSYFPSLTGKKAWPGHHHFVEAKHGTTNVLYAKIMNPNDVLTFDVYVRFSVYDAKYGGWIEPSIDSATVEVLPGQKIEVTAGFNINAPEFQSISKAYIKAELWYYNTDLEEWVKAPLTKWFSFAIVRA